jgi:MoaA/NifB/PqqE/SkfB family radical SAM enzyme
LEKILAEIKSSFFIKPKIHFFGGEPLANPYFSQLLDLADKYRMETSLATNGVLLDRYLDRILKSNLNQMNISIDGLDSTHDRIRGIKGSFKKVMDDIRKLRGKEGQRKKIINVNCLILPGPEGIID